MNSSDPRTVTAVVKRERARRRLRAVTAGTGVLGLAVAGGLALTLPSSAHSTASTTSTSARSSPGSSSAHCDLGEVQPRAAPRPAPAARPAAAVPRRGRQLVFGSVLQLRLGSRYLWRLVMLPPGGYAPGAAPPGPASRA